MSKSKQRHPPKKQNQNKDQPKNKPSIEYINAENNLSKGKIGIIVKNILTFLVNISAVITAIVAIITIREMQEDRNATYQPMILINPTEYTISWDEDGHAEWLSKHTVANPENDDIQFNEDGSISVTMQLALNILYDGLEQFSAVNAGVGIAHNVIIETEI